MTISFLTAHANKSGTVKFQAFFEYFTRLKCRRKNGNYFS